MFHLTFSITLSLVGCFDIICTNFILCVFCKSQCHHFYVEMIAQPVKPRDEFFPVSFKSFENRVFFMISNFIFQLFQHMGHLRVAYHQALQLIFIFDWHCFTYISFHNLFNCLWHWSVPVKYYGFFVLEITTPPFINSSLVLGLIFPDVVKQCQCTFTTHLAWL